MNVIDERFFDHRRRSMGVAGTAGGILAALLWAYRYYTNHVFNWDLLAVAVTIAGIKIILMIWYWIKD
ncbi:MAG TPA: hypothetical protein VER58_06950 [Thermoanaerobaculia bacterium]|nr:hypothetical protein [Thermoanaerobaculia bacterium]